MNIGTKTVIAYCSLIDNPTSCCIKVFKYNPKMNEYFLDNMNIGNQKNMTLNSKGDVM